MVGAVYEINENHLQAAFYYGIQLAQAQLAGRDAEIDRLRAELAYNEEAAVRHHDAAMRALAPGEAWELNGPLELGEHDGIEQV